MTDLPSLYSCSSCWTCGGRMAITLQSVADHGSSVCERCGVSRALSDDELPGVIRLLAKALLAKAPKATHYPYEDQERNGRHPD